MKPKESTEADAPRCERPAAPSRPRAVRLSLVHSFRTDAAVPLGQLHDLLVACVGVTGTLIGLLIRRHLDRAGAAERACNLSAGRT